ncbi:hypothetical protein CWB73_20540 [Pseudoalteromonas phenolica]|uniref:Uncharacterized protein n=1 Tax=Pseudoalteromonas phenolica TaxID=161398 RepID=A0A5S3YMW2_9GAMM|nr:hypothetical protein [Pseudoalteromonas phenolica]TMP77222.1 hypothetical protein CWB73_20540 [Pseudoalteromonas phenolica]
MKPLYKFLILLEALISFGPLVILLGLGLITMPAAVVGLISGEFGGVVLLLVEIGGILGIIAFICVLLHIFEPTKYFIKPKTLRWFIFCGFLSVLTFMFIMGINKSAFWLILPLLVSVHFLYLGRRYVLGNS